MEDEEKQFWTKEIVEKYHVHLSIFVDAGPKNKHRKKVTTLSQLNAAWNSRLTFHMILDRYVELEKETIKLGHFLSSPEEAKEIFKEIKTDSKVWLFKNTAATM